MIVNCRFDDFEVWLKVGKRFSCEGPWRSQGLRVLALSRVIFDDHGLLRQLCHMSRKDRYDLAREVFEMHLMHPQPLYVFVFAQNIERLSTYLISFICLLPQRLVWIY